MGMTRRRKVEGGRRMVAIGLLALAATGCLRIPLFPSLRTVVEPVADDSLLGVWWVHNEASTFESDFEGHRVEVERCGEGYAVSSRDVTGAISDRSYVLLYEVGGRTYAEIDTSDTGADPPPGDWDFLYWVERGEKAVRLRPCSREWLNEHFNAAHSFPFAIVNTSPSVLLEALVNIADDDFEEPDGMSYRRAPSNELDAQLSAN